MSIETSLTEKDKYIINQILLHICSDDKLEDQFAHAVEVCTNHCISRQDFQDWLVDFELV